MPEENEEQRESSRPFWSGTISFGLVSIPVNLFPANRGSQVSLRMLGPNGKPLARQYYSEKTGKDLDAENIIRGYAISENKYVEITDEELERLAPERSRDISLKSFVDAQSIPRIYFEHGYFLLPSGSTRAYHLLAETMDRTGKAGIATFVMRGKEYLVAITSDGGILRAETMRFRDEVRSPKDVGLPNKQKPTPAKVKSMESIITQHARAKLPLTAMRDKNSANLLKLIKRKQKSKKNVVSAGGGKKQKAEVIDILDVLRQSLKQSA